MWHISKEQLILFPLVPLLHHVCHAWPRYIAIKDDNVSFPLFASFCELDKSSIAAEIVNISCQLIIYFLEIWTTWWLQLFHVIWRIICAHLTWFTGCLGNYLAMLRWDMQDMLHRCQLACDEIRGGYVEDVGAIKGLGQKIILPIITQNKSW